MKSLAHDANISMPESPSVKHIALWQFGGLGDMLLATPVIRALGEAWPEAEIHIWCSTPRFAAFLKRFANVKAIHAFPVYEFDNRTLLASNMRDRLYAVREEMRTVAPDVLINLHVPALLDWWAVEWWLVKQLSVPCSLGFNPRFLTRRSVFDVSLNASARDGIHYTALYRKLLDKAGISCDARTVFPLGDEQRAGAASLLAEHDPAARQRVCMHIGGNRLALEHRLWPVERFAELARQLIALGFAPVLIGVEGERAMGKALCDRVPDCINLIGQTGIEEMAALIAESDGFIGQDSGPSHVAAAVGTACVVICGRPDAEPEYLNYGRSDVAVLTANSPELIQVDTVLQRALGLLLHA